MPQTPFATSTWTVRSLRQDTPPAPTAHVPDMPVEILSLEIQEGLETLWDEAGDTPEDARTTPLSAGAGTGNSSGNSGSSNHSGAGASLNASDDAAPATALSQRAAGYQELSQRLGEALAQRVLGQIERGNWEMRLMLKPAKLGEVEIDLTLRSGVLDASFRASNPVTRDLLNEGLPRLREVLANAGMDIAGLNVGSGRNPQTGGNPTPRQARGPDTGTPAQTGSVMATTAASPRLSSTGSGWDVLV
jgi:flagellar hook-length control protein FliK